MVHASNQQTIIENMNITLVKKIKRDGNPCPESAKVLEHLEQLGLLEQIDAIIVADERQPSSQGFALALQHKVEAAPFFIVNNDEGSTHVYTVYYRFLKEVFNLQVPLSQEIDEIMVQYPDLDFVI
jgi:hypothetical protein